jgi:hypothetical protein
MCVSINTSNKEYFIIGPPTVTEEVIMTKPVRLLDRGLQRRDYIIGRDYWIE